MTDATGTSTTTWDSLDRVRQTTSPPVIGAPVSEALVTGEQLDYEYDLAGRLTKISYPALVGRVATITGPDGAPIYIGGRPTVTRRYDDAGLLVEIDDFKARRFLFEYDPDGNLTKQTNPNHTVTALSYDNGGQLARSTTTGPNGELLDLPYTYNASGQIATSTATAALGGVGQSYSYDTLNRLVEAKLPTGQGTDVSREHFTYDAGDRITALGTGPVGAELAYDNAAQLTKATEATTGTQLASFTYDANGNRTKLTDPTGSTVAYGYDQADRLTRYRNPGSTTATTIGSHAAASLTTTTAADVTYRYNGLGLRADLLWDQSLGMPLILADATHLYITGPGGLPLEQVDLAGNALWYHHDQLGSTRALSNQDGHRVATSDYDAYGRPIKPVDNAVQPFGFAGQYTDRQSGLIYMRARWYDPRTGQFLTRDPLGLTAGQNPYHYASNDPINRIDPGGLLDCDLEEVLGAIAQEVAIDLAIAGATAAFRAATGGSIAGAMSSVAVYEAEQVAVHGGGLAARALAKLQTKLANKARARAAARTCGLRSFSANTHVLMADGTTKPIAKLRIGDRVMAADPVTGARGGRHVARVWVHDDTLVELRLGGGRVTTTEDHPFWNATDRRWEDASQFDLGDEAISADGNRIRVGGFQAGSARAGLAYNLTVDGWHTYFVLAGAHSVLVHNGECGFTDLVMEGGRLHGTLPSSTRGLDVRELQRLREELPRSIESREFERATRAEGIDQGHLDRLNAEKDLLGKIKNALGG